MSELLGELGPRRRAAPAAADRRLPRRVPSSARPGHPRRTAATLAAIPGSELREIAEPEICCGSAGVYNLLNPEAARRARRPQGASRPRDRRGPWSRRTRGLPPAGRRIRGPARRPSRSPTPSRSWTPPFAAGPTELHPRAAPAPTLPAEDRRRTHDRQEVSRATSRSLILGDSLGCPRLAALPAALLFVLLGVVR